MSAKWIAFAHAAPDYDYAGAKLEKAWARLHRGDCEPFPDTERVTRLYGAHPKLDAGLAPEKAAKDLQGAWRAYHAGRFGEAIEQGAALGPLGASVAAKSANIYATYLESDEAAKLDLFQQATKRAEVLQGIAKDECNAFYFHAQALGRYSQGVSIAKALAQGLGGKIKSSLEQAIKLQPEHADARIGLGAYHAEVIAKVGALVGGLTYGASKEESMRHFQAALERLPDAAIPRIEYANALVMLYGKAKMKEATRLYEEATKCVPHDAMERLDVELAKSELED